MSSVSKAELAFTVQETRRQLAGTLLLILTVASVVAAVLSFKHLRAFPLPDDGVTWVDRQTAGKVTVVASYITPDGSGEKAGIRVGDRLISIGGTPIQRSLDVARSLAGVPVLSQTKYTLERGGIEFQKDNIFIQAAARDSALYYQYGVGLAYLAIGLFVHYRRTSATKSLHFFVLCLASFIASTFHYSGKLNAFDELLYWSNVIAGLFAPAIFLHFCLTFHQKPGWLSRPVAALALYLPSAFLIALIGGTATGTLHFGGSLLEARWLFDRLSLASELLLYAAGVVALTWALRDSHDSVLRLQLKFLRNGALVGLLPFSLFYAIPFILGNVPHHIMNLSVLTMGLIPLTWAYAITRYRLMDVDIIFQQGYVYTLATLAVIGIFYGLLFFLFDTSTVTPPAFVVLLSFATLLFGPIRKWLQEILDRHLFYRDRYDSRVTLIEFARELSSETDQDVMLAKVGDRLLRTLSLQHIGFFLLPQGSGSFVLHSKLFKSDKVAAKASLPSSSLDLSFLSNAYAGEYLFFERTRHMRDIYSRQMPQAVRDSIAELDFTYYIPCRSRGRTIAFLGITRTTEGEFLSKDDLELLLTLSNYVAIAIENSRLYSSLQQKADEYEKLKEFSENIVESINVGVLAVGLDDRVESWNPQIERLTGIVRDEAVGRRLSDLFGPELSQKFDEVRVADGIHNFYKLPLRRRSRYATSTSEGDGSQSHPLPGPGAVPTTLSAGDSIVNIAVAPLVSKEMARIGRLVIFDDITDRDELERRLVQADKLSSIGLLAAGVAHEVNTPLAVISTYAQMLTKQVATDDPKSKMLEKIAKQTFRASEIVNSLLNFSRTSPIEFVDLDLNKVLRETSSLVEHQFQKVGVNTSLNLTDIPLIVRGNAGKLQQVFLNLFINARDAMVGGGTLAIHTRVDSGFVHVDVQDTGQGITPENLERIYDPFFTTKGAKKGTGLGLSITYGIVQEHKGTIEVQSTLGRGTCFHVEFPASLPRLASVPQSQQQPLPA